MLVAWLIGLFLNFIAFYLWRNSYYDIGDCYERIPINIMLFIALIIQAFIPCLNVIIGLVLLVILGNMYTEDLEFHGPKWMCKSIK